MKAGSVITLRRPSDVKKLRTSVSDRLPSVTPGRFLGLLHACPCPEKSPLAEEDEDPKVPIKNMPRKTRPRIAAMHLPQIGTFGIKISLAVTPPPTIAMKRKITPVTSSMV
jgi:hypothetical protein